MNIVHWNVPTKIVEKLNVLSDDLMIPSDFLESGEYSDQILHLITAEDYFAWQQMEGFLSEYSKQPLLIIGELPQVVENLVGQLTPEILLLDDMNLTLIYKSFLRGAKYFYLEKEIDNITLEMDKMHNRIFSELTLSKKIYQRVVPLREDTFSSCRIGSKFESGLKGGGEFFDWREMNGKIFVYLFSTNSYSLTANLSRYFADFLEAGLYSTSEQMGFEKTIQSIIADFQLKKRADVDYLFFTIDSTSLALEGRSCGEHKIYTSEGEFLGGMKDTAQTALEGRLNRDEILVIQSSGFVKSQKELIGNKVTLESITDVKEESTRNFFDIKFKQLVEKSNDDFLPYDSTLIKIEVIKNGMFQV